MRLDIELESEIIKTKDEKEALMLYETLGKEICRKYKFNYSRLLELMIRREEQRKD